MAYGKPGGRLVPSLNSDARNRAISGECNAKGSVHAAVLPMLQRVSHRHYENIMGRFLKVVE